MLRSVFSPSNRASWPTVRNKLSQAEPSPAAPAPGTVTGQPRTWGQVRLSPVLVLLSPQHHFPSPHSDEEQAEVSMRAFRSFLVPPPSIPDTARFSIAPDTQGLEGSHSHWSATLGPGLGGKPQPHKDCCLLGNLSRAVFLPVYFLFGRNTGHKHSVPRVSGSPSRRWRSAEPSGVARSAHGRRLLLGCELSGTPDPAHGTLAGSELHWRKDWFLPGISGPG